MRGKFITTSLKLAVKSKTNRNSLLEVKETTASIQNFETIWSKAMYAVEQNKVSNLRTFFKVA